MWARISKLMDVKSIVTLQLTTVYSVLILRGDQIPEQFAITYTTIMAFYFGVKYAQYKIKKEESDNEQR